MPKPTHHPLAPLVALADEWATEGPSLVRHACGARDVHEGSTLEKCAADLGAAIAEASALLGEVREEWAVDYSIPMGRGWRNGWTGAGSRHDAMNAASRLLDGKAMRRHVTEWQPVRTSDAQEGAEALPGVEVGASASESLESRSGTIQEGDL